MEADFLNHSISDHTPILIKFGRQRLLHPKPFRLYDSVMEDPQFKNILQQVWSQGGHGTPMQQIWHKLKEMKQQLKDLNRYMASYQQKLIQAREKLDIIQSQLRSNPGSIQLFNEEKEAILNIEKWSNVEEQVLRQKSKATWIDCDDSNTKYFHAQWKMRSSQRNISSIYTDTGTKLTVPLAIEQEFIAVFKSLMGDRPKEVPCLNSAIVKEGGCLSLEQQRTLIKEVTMEEITAAVKEMPNDKAPGVDGFTVEFFTKNWETVKMDVFAATKEFFITGHMPYMLNTTAIALVPKTNTPKTVKDFRPIACCTTLYKIISKVITKRLKTVIDCIIGKGQSAFIEGRSILDNVLLSHELFKGYGRKGISP